MTKILSFFYIFLFLLYSPLLMANQQVEREKIQLTLEEQQWINSHIVQVGVEQWSPVVFSNNGSDIDGVTGDFLKRIIQSTGLKIQIINDNWNDLLKDFKDQKIDLLPATYFTVERAEFGLYSSKYFKLKDYLYINQNNNSIKSMSDLNGKKLAIIEGYGTIDKIKEKFPNIKLIYTKDLDDSINQVLNNTADALYEGQIAVEKKINEELITGLKGIAQSSFKSPGIHFFSNIEQPLLQSILQKGLENISIKERDKILSKWLSNVKPKESKAALNTEDKKITVAIDYEYTPLTYKSFQGKPEGLFVEFWKLWSQKSGYKVEFKFYNWNASIEAVKNGEVIFHSGLYIDQEWSVNSDKFYELKTTFYQLKNSASKKKPKIGLIDNSYAENVYQYYPDAEIIIYEDYGPLLHGLLDHSIDLFYDDEIAVDMFLLKHGAKLKLEKLNDKSSVSNIYAITNKSNEQYIKIFNQGLSKINKEELAQIELDILGHKKGYYSGFLKFLDKSLNLSKEEKAWLQNKPLVNVGGELDWAPFDFVKDGKYQGISKEIIDLIVKKTDLNIQYITGQTWKELLQDFRVGKLDILPAMYFTDSREEYTNFTKPYFKIKDYVFARSDDKSIKTQDDLKNKKIAVLDGYAIIDNLIQKLPNIDLLRVNSIQEGINAVLVQKADVYIVSYPTMMYTLASMMQTGMKPVLPIDYYTNDLRIGINKSKPILASIIKKSLNAISIEEKNNIFNKWAAIKEINQKIILTESEKLWVQQNPIINVANEMDWPPFDYNEFDKPKGLSIDYIQLLAKKIGIKIAFVNGHSWPKLLELFKNKYIDVLPALYRNSEREQYTLYTSPYYKGKLGIFTRKEDQSIQAYTDLIGKKVGMQTADGAIPIVKKYIPDIEISELENNSKLVQALSTKKFDAIIGNPLLYYHYANENQITNLHLVDYLSMDQQQQLNISLHIGVQKENKLLHQILKKAMKSISQQEMKKLHEKWTFQRTSTEIDKRIPLSNKEATWIKKHPIITYSEVNWKPLSIIENNKMTGIMGDYLDLVSKRTGINFKLVPASSWPNVLDLFKSEQIDLIPGIGFSDQEKELGLLSNRYAKYPMAIVTGNDYKYIENLSTLKGKKIAVPKFYTSYNFLLKNYPDLTLMTTKDVPEALLLVQNEQADAFVGHIAPALYYLSKLNLSNLKISGTTNFDFEHSYLVQKKYPVLQSILNKAVKSITEKEKAKIYSNWVQTTVQQKVDYTLLIQIVTVLLLVVIAIVYWNYKLKALVAAKTRSLKEFNLNLENIVAERTYQLNQEKSFVSTLLDSQEQLIITTDGKKIRTANQSLFQYYHVNSTEQFIEKFGKCICETFDTNAPTGYLQKNMGEQNWIEYIISNPGKSHKAQICQNNLTSIFSVSASKLTSQDKLNLAVFTDITEMEKVKKEVEEINKHTRDSIEYASLIQGALIPDNHVFDRYFNDSFAIWHPKDIVGGDIYLVEEINENEVIIMVIDCTGHGVPGAFVTMLVKAVERQLTANLNEENVISPAKILSLFNKSIKHLLQQESVDSISNAGFDGGILYYNKTENLYHFQY